MPDFWRQSEVLDRGAGPDKEPGWRNGWNVVVAQWVGCKSKGQLETPPVRAIATPETCNAAGCT